MIDFSVHGLDELIAALERLPYSIDEGMDTFLLERARQVETRLIGATPVDTGATQAGWEVDDHRGPHEVAVVNTYRTDRGFPVASALLTGTGIRGAGATPASGYTGSFAGAWPGMLPAKLLQAAWNYEAARTLADPLLLAEIYLHWGHP